MEDQLLLRNPDEFPNKSVLKNALGDKYSVFEAVINKLENELALLLEWNYYNDGKQWLCKVLHKKKNLCWLSVWDSGLKATLFFTDKTLAGVSELDIDEQTMDAFRLEKAVGKLIPLIVLLDKIELLDAFLKIIEYKKNLK